MAPHHTQWAAQFAVASELCKFGCDVSFTMGNCTPLADLMVLSPTQETFLVDVKGQSTKNFWRIKPKPVQANLFYVLCYVAPRGRQNEFFVLSQATLNAHLEAYAGREDIRYDARFAGMNWGTAKPYRDCWSELPLGLAPAAAVA
jgi:hypothetical protein